MFLVRPTTTRAALALALATAALAAPAAGQGEPPPAPPREFRAAWVASVANIDWPSARGLSTIRQQDELLQLLDRAVELRLNAIVLQVRPESDALYASTLEPWSEYLTGTAGQAPAPFYDPLAFAVREAHLRGLELHAWVNPFRARGEASKSAPAAMHVTRTNPGLVRRYGSQLWLDPGEAEVRRRAMNVVLDIVRRYDIDAVHIDDYFYPYRENDRRGRTIPFPDDASYARYRRSGGQLAREDWRRENVNTFVRDLYAGVKKVKPTVRVGVSPFGIWRPGSPPGVLGLDAYNEIFADARKWLNNGWLDYLSPQLYFSLDRPNQSYTALLAWWVGENRRNRNVWPGLFTSRVGVGRQPWPASEIVEQIRLTRAQPGATGEIHFSMKSLLDNRGGIADALRTQSYAEQALVPASPWLDGRAPTAPVVEARPTPGDSVGMALRAGGKESDWLYVVQARYGSRWTTRVVPGYYPKYAVPSTLDGARAERVVVRAVDRVGNLSAPRSLAVPGTVGVEQVTGSN